MRVRAWLGSTVSLMMVSLAVATGSAAAAPPPPGQDPFYHYDGSTPIEQVAPGAVLKTRTTWLHVVGVPVPIKAVQLLYRSTEQRGQATTNVTSVLKPPVQLGAPKLVSYQSFYDSLNPDDEPSYAISGGGLSIGGAIPQLESGLVSPLLLAGYTIAVPDTEGQRRGLRRRSRVRHQHARRHPRGGQREHGHGRQCHHEGRAHRLLRRRDRDRVGRRAGALLCARRQRRHRRLRDGRRPRRSRAQPALRRRHERLGRRPADGHRGRRARVRHRPHALPQRRRASRCTTRSRRRRSATSSASTRA